MNKRIIFNIIFGIKNTWLPPEISIRAEYKHKTWLRMWRTWKSARHVENMGPEINGCKLSMHGQLKNNLSNDKTVFEFC